MLEVRSATVVVSGYPPVAAVRLMVDGRPAGAVSAGLDVSRYLQGLPPVIRCGVCRGPAPPDPRLGTIGHCQPCVEAMLPICLGVNRRLPGPGEFYCAGCQAIVVRGQLAASDPDGRRRWRCRACRGRQLREAKARYMIRHPR